MQDFVYNANPGRVLFGQGKLAELPEEMERLNLKRSLVLSTVGRAEMAHAIAERMQSRCAGVFTNAAMHTPIPVTEQAMAIVQEFKADGVVAIGGGSSIGLAKAIALRTDLPQIVIPTTYAGSEMTPIIGETEDGAKTTQTTPKVLPEVVIYDVDLTMSLPLAVTVVSGMNAIAHAVEALYARERNPITNLMAQEGVRALVEGLPKIAANPERGDGRTQSLYGAWLCGICLGSVGMALHHKLCHTLGGTFGLPHAETHSIILPHALAYNAPAIPEAIAQLSVALNKPDPARTLYDLAGALGAPRALKDIGMPKSGIEEATKRALANPYWNPRPLEENAISALIARAWAGDPPQHA